MVIKAATLQEVAALPITQALVNREAGPTSQLRLSELGTLAIVRVRKNAVQSLTDVTEAALAWQIENFDTAFMHDNAVNNTRLVAPLKGIYRVDVVLHYAANAVGQREIRYSISGGSSASILIADATAAGIAVLHASTTIALVSKDYVEILGFQSSTGALDVLSGGAGSFAVMTYLGE